MSTTLGDTHNPKSHHIAVFETIVKDLWAGPAASEKESISREFKMPF